MSLRWLALAWVAGLALYGPALGTPWALDDWIWLHGAREGAFFRPHGFDFVRPVATAWFWLVGVSPVAAHVASALLHATTAWLLGLWLERRGAPPWAAAVFLAAGGLAEAVVWPSAVGDLLVGFGTVLALTGLDRGRPVLVAAGWLVAVPAKESAVTLPFVLVLADLMFHRVRWGLHAVMLAATAAWYGWEWTWLSAEGTGYRFGGHTVRDFVVLAADGLVVLPLHRWLPVVALVPVVLAAMAGAARSVSSAPPAHAPSARSVSSAPSAHAPPARARVAAFGLAWTLLAALPFAVFKWGAVEARYLYLPALGGTCLLAALLPVRALLVYAAVQAVLLEWWMPALVADLEGYRPVAGEIPRADRVRVWLRPGEAPWVRYAAAMRLGLPEDRVLPLRDSSVSPGEVVLVLDRPTMRWVRVPAEGPSDVPRFVDGEVRGPVSPFAFGAVLLETREATRAVLTWESEDGSTGRQDASWVANPYDHASQQFWWHPGERASWFAGGRLRWVRVETDGRVDRTTVFPPG